MKKKGVIFTMEDARRYGVIEALREGKMNMRQRYALDFGPRASTGECCCVSISKHILRRIRNPATET